MNASFSYSIAISVLLGAGLIAQTGQGQTSGGDLAAAKALYASASYEEALSRLPGVGSMPDPEQTEQYRALCLLALGRPDEATKSLERLVARTPLYSMNDAEVSPRLVTMYHDVRKRLLPTVAADLFAKAKANFSGKRFAEASAQLKDLLAVVADPDAAGPSGAGLDDLKLLGEGFLKLAESELASAPNVRSASVSSAAIAPPGRPASAPAGTSRVYSLDDKEIKAPVAIKQDMPLWVSPSTPLRANEYRGAIEVVIDEQGSVESAVLRQSVSKQGESPLIVKALEAYEAALFAATKQWRFRPALKDDEPVKFRSLVGIVLRN